MKSNINAKILKLAIVEILGQSGFDKSAEQSLNVLTDVMKYYIERLTLKIKKVQDRGVVSEQVIKFIISDYYDECRYQIQELYSFLRYQVNIKNYLSEKYDVGCEESLLHTLRVLPKNVQLRSILRSSKTVGNLNEVQDSSDDNSIVYDDFMANFVKDCISEQSRRVVGEYKFQLMDLIVGETDNNKIEIDKGEFNDILEKKRAQVEFLSEPTSPIDDLSIFNRMKVFK